MCGWMFSLCKWGDFTTLLSYIPPNADTFNLRFKTHLNRRAFCIDKLQIVFLKVSVGCWKDPTDPHSDWGDGAHQDRHEAVVDSW